jgi:hypothetical protein
MNTKLAGLIFGTAMISTQIGAQTSAELWAQFLKNPYNHPNIPNVSFAGYRFCEAKLPEPRVVANVKTEGGKGDGVTDDTVAFRLAVEKAQKAGGGVILVPAGNYRITGMVALNSAGLVLRGEGTDKTILSFQKPISEVVKGVSGSWFGGLIWIDPLPPAPEIEPTMPAQVVDVIKPAKMGDFSVEVSPEGAAKLRPLIGKMVPVSWQGDLTLCHARL